MSTTRISFGFAFAFMLSCIPLISHAYFTTEQASAAITKTTALFTISYTFGLEEHDIYMPIIATRGLEWKGGDQEVGYTFTEDDEVHENGTAAALVLSNAPVVNNMYKIEKGTAKTMTLFAMLVTDQDEHEEDYALQVTQLPYYVDRGNGKLETLQLNPSELQYYVTKEIELNTGNFD